MTLDKGDVQSRRTITRVGEKVERPTLSVLAVFHYRLSKLRLLSARSEHRTVSSWAECKSIIRYCTYRTVVCSSVDLTVSILNANMTENNSAGPLALPLHSLHCRSSFHWNRRIQSKTALRNEPSAEEPNAFTRSWGVKIILKKHYVYQLFIK